MGRAVAFLADCVALARLLVDARDVARAWRHRRAPEGADRPRSAPREDVPVGPTVATAEVAVREP